MLTGRPWHRVRAVTRVVHPYHSAGAAEASRPPRAINVVCRSRNVVARRKREGAHFVKGIVKNKTPFSIWKEVSFFIT